MLSHQNVTATDAKEAQINIPGTASYRDFKITSSGLIIQLWKMGKVGG